MISGITWTHVQSVWNHSGPSEVLYSLNQYLASNFFSGFLLQTGSKTIIDTYQVKCDTPTRDIMDKIIDMVRNGKS